MLVALQTDASASIVVSEYFNLDQFGEFLACAAADADGRLFQFTARNAPDVAGYTARLAELPTKCVVIVRAALACTCRSCLHPSRARTTRECATVG
jgi:hypothetical protein